MGWLIRERRGLSWRDQTIESASTPPIPLIAFFGLVILLMYLASYSESKAHEQRSKNSMRLLLFLLPMLVVLMVYAMLVNNRWFSPDPTGGPRPVLYESMRQEGSPPWGPALLVVLLLLIVHYQNS
ncbi:uncharacterized protein LOC132035266 [Lycium ferocissimum]|uniref:uncharacterized protein LOC132035266 n=1 Tax=Lycium ferocissimum TaxID=112874 RepID=UPI0028152C14|nr:uncharacterized protein LOC132035266 [Lycium ferocissimum]